MAAIDLGSIDEFVEAADFAVCRLVLVEKGKIGVVELVEEVVPRDVIELFILRLKVKPEDAGLPFEGGAADGRGGAAAFLGPMTDLLMIGGELGV